MIKTNLRWAGGKTRIVKIIDDFFPKKITSYFEVFVGGGSVLLHVIQKYKPYKIIANDINEDLIRYYLSVKNKCKTLQQELYEIKNNYTSDSFKEKFKKLNENNPTEFFIRNKTSFSGLFTNYSKLAFEKNFTVSSINKINDISKLIQQVDFINYDFEKYNKTLKDYFIYLDPPYYLNSKKGLYGKKGILHKTFNHKALFNFVEKYGKNNKILISYDDCEFIRELYKGYNIYNFNITYSMTNTGGNKCKKGKEIIITNYKIEGSEKN